MAGSVDELLPQGGFPGEWAWTVEAFADAEAGPDLAWQLASGDPDRSSDEALVAAVVAFKRAAAWAEAGAARAAAALSRRASMNPDWPPSAGAVSVRDVTAEELAPALGVSRRTARRLVTDGQAFDGALSPTGDALARGEIDLTRARVLVDALAEVPVELAFDVQDQVLPGAGARTAAELTRDVARALVIADPAGAQDRTVHARDRRRLDRPRPLPDGMAGVWAVLPAADALVVDSTVDSIARAGRAAGDPRTLDQLRADVFVDLLLGRVEGPECHGPSTALTGVARTAARPAGETPARPTAPADPEADTTWRPRRAVRASVDVLVPIDVLLGLSDGPAEIAGYGPIPAAVARELAEDATWRRILTDPVTGAALDVGRTRYRPPARLATHVRARDRRCAFPGCSARAETCDLDHTAEWDRDRGSTAHDNLGPLCPRHHQVKTSGGFALRQVDPGVFEWTTPLGAVYRVQPGLDRAYERVEPVAPPPF
jgi:hypothetical protein